MAQPDNSTPVLVLKATHHGGLGIARSLGSMGVPVYVAGESGFVTPGFSRFCRGRVRWSLREADPAASLESLLEAGRKLGGRPVLIPTTDETALFVADHGYALSSGFRFPNQRAETARALSRKETMHYLANRLGIPTPRTHFPQSREEVVEIAASANFPLVLKALDYSRQRKRRAEERSIAPGKDEFLRTYDRMQDPEVPNLIVQEYIPGGDDSIWMFNGYFDSRSECLFGITGRKIRQCPVYTGPSCLAVCLSNETVRRQTLALMEATEYRGILDIGYRYDARDGKYKLLDVNPRIGSTFRLFVGQAGMDVARAMYLDLTGQRVPADFAREGRKWLVEDWDLVSSARYWRDGKLTVREWVRSFRGVEENALFWLRDPLPGLAVLLGDLFDFTAVRQTQSAPPEERSLGAAG